MSSFVRQGRRRAVLLWLVVSLALAVPWLRPDARAASGAATDADVTWGVNLTPDGWPGAVQGGSAPAAPSP